MRRPRHAAALIAGALGALLAAGTLGVAPSTAAAGPSSALSPTAQARAKGITTPGTAHMGWSQTAPKTVPSLARASAAAAGTQTPGIDVSSHQGNVTWSTQWSAGKKFAYVKATEGTSYRNPYFGQQYTGSYGVGMIRGAYHFALPSSSSARDQANHFVANGGGWSRDGKTLPGVLDIEYNPYGATCYGLSQATMRSWIASFASRYKTLTGRDVIIYSTTDWMTQCTGNTGAFASRNPLWIARYASSAGTLPRGWDYYSFWQYTSTPIDQNYFNGTMSQLRSMALG